MNNKDLLNRIEFNPEILGGKPVIAGTRIPVELILEFLGHDWDIKKILDEYPDLRQKDVKAAIHYAANQVKNEEIHFVPATPVPQRASAIAR